MSIRYRLDLGAERCEFLDDNGNVISHVGLSRLHPQNNTLLRFFLHYNASRVLTREDVAACVQHARAARQELMVLRERR